MLHLHFLILKKCLRVCYENIKLCGRIHNMLVTHHKSSLNIIKRYSCDDIEDYNYLCVYPQTLLVE